MKTLRIFTILLALALAGCAGKPESVAGSLPADKAAYAGEWESKTLYLLITPDGNVTYRRTGPNSNVSISAPIEAFHGNDFDVGVGLLKTTFHVGKPPYREDGQWKMVVDGVPLTRAPAAVAQPAPAPSPAPAPAPGPAPSPAPAPAGQGREI